MKLAYVKNNTTLKEFTQDISIMMVQTKKI